MAPNSAPQKPAQDTTMSAANLAVVGAHAGDAATGVHDVGDLVLAEERARRGRSRGAACASTAAYGVGQAVGGDVQAAEDPAGSSSG